MRRSSSVCFAWQNSSRMFPAPIFWRAAQSAMWLFKFGCHFLFQVSGGPTCSASLLSLSVFCQCYLSPARINSNSLERVWKGHRLTVPVSYTIWLTGVVLTRAGNGTYYKSDEAFFAAQHQQTAHCESLRKTMIFALANLWRIAAKVHLRILANPCESLRNHELRKHAKGCETLRNHVCEFARKLAKAC